MLKKSFLQESNPFLYLKVTLVPVFLVLVLLVPSYIFLIQTDEIASMKDIVAKQVKNDTRYGPIDFHRYSLYKQELYKYHKSDVVALGSSRVWRFYPESFTKSFLSLGSMVFGVEQVDTALKAVYETHAPKLILLGLDYWWFHERSVEPLKRFGPKIYADVFYPSFFRYFFPYGEIVKGKISFSDFWRMIVYGGEQSGYGANFSMNGIDKSGRPFYSTEIAGFVLADDFEFRQSFKEISQEDYHFLYGDKIKATRWESFSRSLQYLKEMGTEVILFLPPIAPDVYKYMLDSGNFGYIQDLAHHLEEQSYFEFYNYSDARVLGSTNCEFRDGLHGGDVLNRRVLKDMVSKTKTSLPQLVNMNDINIAISESAGYVTHPHGKEVDFLGLGCSK